MTGQKGTGGEKDSTAPGQSSPDSDKTSEGEAERVRAYSEVGGTCPAAESSSK